MDKETGIWLYSHVSAIISGILLLKEGLQKRSNKRLLKIGLWFIISEYIILTDMGFWSVWKSEWKDYKNGERTLWDLIRRNILIVE